MILTVGNIKGGVGKTTLAVNITIDRVSAGRDVLLVDGDEQGTASVFTEVRTQEIGQAGYTAVRLIGKELRSQIRQLATKYDDIVIDVGGRDTGSLRAALTVSDVLLIPVQPRSFDLWTIEQTVEQVREARDINPKLRAVFVLNFADPQGRDNADTADALKDFAQDVQWQDTVITRRKAFPNAASNGLSVIEAHPADLKAIEELQALTHSLYATEPTA